MEQADFIVNARWTVPVIPHGTVLENHCLVVRDGRILDLLPRARAGAIYEAREWIARPEHVLVPGLINAHTHATMTLMRGMADDMPLTRWLEDYIWPTEMRWVSADFVRDGTELAIVEMISGGTTCFNDMYFFPDIVAQSAVDHGIRAAVGMILIENPTPWAASIEEYFSKGLAVHDRFLSSELVTTMFAPHAPYTVSDDTFHHLALLANELETGTHMHVHETAHEVEFAMETDGRRPLARLDQLGLLNASLCAVHMTQLLQSEIEQLAERGVSIVHCPESNLKLASGFCPVAELLRAGVNVALGTDGAGSNNDLDMLAEMRTAALLGKGVAGDATAVSAEEALAMATINGARALGLANQTGSLEHGKWADFICVDLGAPATQPVHNPVSQLVYAAGRDQVTDTWAGGRALMTNRQMTRANTTDIIRRAQAWQRRLSKTEQANQ
jgi:5-methylthioadenosine/S-adenosylhomocysteine deaminase